MEVRVWAAVEAVSDLFSDGSGGKIELTAEKNRRNCRRKRDARRERSVRRKQDDGREKHHLRAADTDMESE